MTERVEAMRKHLQRLTMGLFLVLGIVTQSAVAQSPAWTTQVPVSVASIPNAFINYLNAKLADVNNDGLVDVVAFGGSVQAHQLLFQRSLFGYSKPIIPTQRPS